MHHQRLASAGLLIGLAVCALMGSFWPHILAVLSGYMILRGLIRNNVQNHLTPAAIMAAIYVYQMGWLKVELNNISLAVIFAVLALWQLARWTQENN